MKKRTTGVGRVKKSYKSQEEFLGDFQKGNTIKLDGYQIIGRLAFIPTGSWANALRARSIIEKDFMDGLIEEEPDFILLQYGGTLQICSYKKISEIDNPPVLKGGIKVDDLGVYMTSILKNFQKHFNYYEPDTTIGQDEITVSGGHGGIGSISNIFGTCKIGRYAGLKFLDMFKNKIISDISGVDFNLSIQWSEPAEYKSAEPQMDNKVILAKDVTTLDPRGRILKND